MSDSDAEEVVVERLPPDEAFELLAHETRFRTLETLNDADGALEFGELRERVGVRDPGQFNYHLTKLSGRFVREADGASADGVGGDPTESGYRLTEAGEHVVASVLSGGYTKVLDADPVAIDADCLVCGGPMETRFRESGVVIACEECGRWFTDTEIPPGVLEGSSREQAPAVVDRWLKMTQAMAEYGFCYNCNGRLDVTLHSIIDDSPPELLDEFGLEAVLAYECGRCGNDWLSSAEVAVLWHPAVVGFHYEHGIDVRETPVWDLEWFEFGVATVTNEAPFRLDVPITLDGETLAVTFDETLDVVETQRK